VTAPSCKLARDGRYLVGRLVVDVVLGGFVVEVVVGRGTWKGSSGATAGACGRTCRS
jgi:hypothetical protein